MSTTIVKGKRGYVDETNFALRDVPTEFQLFGNGLEDSKLPKEKVTPLMKQLSSSFVATSIKVDAKTVEFTFTYQLVDGKDISYIAAVIATTDNQVAGTPDYKHLVTPVLPSQAYSLPSRTVHIELYDENDNFLRSLDVCGCLVKTLEIKHVLDDADGVVVVETYIGQRITTNSPTTNLLGLTSTSVQDPELVEGQYYANSVADASNKGSAASDSDTDTLSFILRAGAGYATNTQPFKVQKSNVDAINIGGTIQLDDQTPATFGTVSGGTNLTAYFKSFGIKIDFIYKESRPDRSGTNNNGATISNYLMNALVESCNISTVLQLDTDTAAFDLMLDGLKDEINNALYILVEKFNDAGDWIAFCLAPVSGTVNNVHIDLEATFPFISNTDYYTFTYACKDINAIVGNDFSVLRAVS